MSYKIELNSSISVYNSAVPAWNAQFEWHYKQYVALYRQLFAAIKAGREVNAALSSYVGLTSFAISDCLLEEWTIQIIALQ